MRNSKISAFDFLGRELCDMESIQDMFSNFNHYVKKRGLNSEECEQLLKSNQIVIMGAGNCGTVLFERLRRAGIAVCAFIDNLGSIHGKEYCGVPIYTSEEFLDRAGNVSECICIVALLDILSYEQIKAELTKASHGLLRVYYFTQFRAYDKVFGIEKKPEFSAYLGEDATVLYDHRERIMSVYNLLADDQSRKCYLELLNFYISSDFVGFTVLPFEEHYFAYDLYKKVDHEVFVDCGAYNGDTLDIFLKNQEGLFGRYLAIEADGINYRKIVEKVEKEGVERIDVLQRYIADRRKKISFTGNGTSYSKGEDGLSGETIETVTIDELAYQYKPTFLKVNIEGADVDAIKGAKKVISEFAPIVAAQGHHKAEHLWEIVETIHGFNKKDYHFFLRNYGGISEYTFYAIPENRLI